MTLDIFDIIFFPVDSVGGLPGLLAQTLACMIVGAIPGLIFRVNLFTVSLMYIGIFTAIFSIALLLSIGILVYSIGMVIVGISAGAALHETIRQVAKPNRH